MLQSSKILTTGLTTLFVSFLTLVACLAVNSEHAFAATDDFETWLQMTASGPLGDTPWRGFFEFQPRFSDNSSDLDRVIMRPAIGRALGSGITAYVGYAYQPIMQTPTFHYNWKNEHRSYQELRGDHTLANGWSLANRFRFEQRFIDGVGGEPLFRTRYQVRSVIPLDDTFGVGVANEVFFNLNSTDRGPKNGFDQNRATLSLVVKTDHKVTYEVGYVNNWVHSANKVDRDNHVLCLSAAYKWG